MTTTMMTTTIVMMMMNHDENNDDVHHINYRCFSLIFGSFSLWLRLDTNSSDSAGEDVHNSYDGIGFVERRS